MCSHLNDATQELTGKLGKSFVSECRMAAVSNTMQSTDKSKSGTCRKHAKNQVNEAPVPEQILCTGALESDLIQLEVSGKICCR